MPKQQDLILHTLKVMDQKLTAMEQRLDSIDKSMVKNTHELAVHVKRTDVAESNTELLRQELRHEMQPVKRHIAYMEGVLKALGIAATLVAVTSGVISIFS